MANSERDEQLKRTGRVLGDTDPEPRPASPQRPEPVSEEEEDPGATSGGSQHDRTRHSGSRDVTEGTTGGLGPETGGTRNYRQGSGATGGDIGNRPE